MDFLIGLHGRRGSGKDTAFRFIHGWATGRGAQAHRAGFADKLKQSAYRLFQQDCSVGEALHWADDMKTIGDIEARITVEHPGGETRTLTSKISGRMFLQRYGTEAHRDVFGDDFWVDALLPHPDSGQDWRSSFLSGETFGDVLMVGDTEHTFYVVTDVRFENEAKRIKELGGVVWQIDRSTDTQDDHASEASLPSELIDDFIPNHGSLTDLETEVRSLLTADYHMKFVENDMDDGSELPA
jgi:hypothetical protein